MRLINSLVDIFTDDNLSFILKLKYSFLVIVLYPVELIDRYLLRRRIGLMQQKNTIYKLIDFFKNMC